jgi:glycosyltransferase involved in cell wall biosynthesis
MTREIVSPRRSAEATCSVVVGIPAYNEEETIEDIVSEANTYVDDVIVVDDGSSDRTVSRARASGATVVEHQRNQGYGSALQTIFTEADERGVDHLAVLDADGQHDPSDVARLVETQRETGASVVIGSRFAPGSSTDVPLYRRFGLTVINTLTNFGLQLAYATPRITDTQSGFRVYDANAIDTMRQSETLGEGMDASIDILFEAAEAGHEFVESPIDVTYDVENANTHNPVAQGLILLMNIFARVYDERRAG